MDPNLNLLYAAMYVYFFHYIYIYIYITILYILVALSNGKKRHAYRYKGTKLNWLKKNEVAKKVALMFTNKNLREIRRLLNDPLAWVQGRAKLAAAMYCAHPVRATNYTKIQWSEFDSGHYKSNQYCFICLHPHKTYKVCMIDYTVVTEEKRVYI